MRFECRCRHRMHPPELEQPEKTAADNDITLKQMVLETNELIHKFYQEATRLEIWINSISN